jgi:signal transduction histidine kinase
MSTDARGSQPPARHPRVGWRSIVRTAVTDSQPASALDSERVAEARARAQERLHRQRQTLRPLGWSVILVVVLGSANSEPVPGLHGKTLTVTLGLFVFAAALVIAIRDDFPERSVELQAAVIAVMGAAGVAIAGLQLKGATEVAAGVAVFMAITRLPFKAGVAMGGAVTLALGAVTAIAGNSASAVAAGTLVTVLLGVVAQFLKQSRESQDRTEILLAQLEDARDEHARAAAITERGRIASELHDVLAHSLSGAAIQLQGARKLADREHAQPPLSDTIDRASELVKDGLVNARQAVGALRGDALPTVAQLPSLIDSYKADMNLDVTLRIEGDARTLRADPSLSLYRGAQEALTNVARYAPSACTTVTVRYEDHCTKLSVDNGVSGAPPRDGMGGGRGLEGLRERVERAGGTMSAGPTTEGWRVEIEMPA